MNKALITMLVCLMIWMLPTQAKSEEEATPAANYYKIVEPFTINFVNQSNSLVRFLQIRVALMSHDAEVIQQAELNLPMIQDSLRNLFTDQTYQSVSSVEGRLKLQADALNLLKTQLAEETGNDKLEAVYFTSFILQ
jgi:flagellar FliL protein